MKFYSKSMTTSLVRACLILVAVLFVPSTQATFADTLSPPNIVIIFIDDMGYADIEPFGGAIKTPNLNAMASRGMRCTDFQVSAAVCSASRAALLTGCYHPRVGINGALMPNSTKGINSDETTIAEMLKSKGYSTACFGKWHLGHQEQFMPTKHGFDEYFGLPYSNDMWTRNPVKWKGKHANGHVGWTTLPLIEGTKVLIEDVTPEDQAQLTTQYTEHAVDFIDRNSASKKPFFLYVPHSMVHVPLYVSEKFKGKSDQGLYGDVVMEVDWSVGQITEALERNGVMDNTLVVFTSDNGPWLNYGNHAGSAGPLREGKQTMFEGGCRVPTIMQWPQTIPAGSTCDQLISSIDLLPTIAAMTGADLPEKKIDGLSILSVLKDPQSPSPRESFCHYFYTGELHAVRDARWKLHFPHRYGSLDGKPGGQDGASVRYVGKKTGKELYDLKNDVGETTNVIADHTEIVERLDRLADSMRSQLGDALQKKKGPEIRPAGRIAVSK